MAEDRNQTEGGFETHEDGEGHFVVSFSGRMDAAASGRLIRELDRFFRKKNPTTLTADLSGPTYFDEYGALVLLNLKKNAQDAGAAFSLKNVSGKVSEFLSLIDFENLDKSPAVARKKRPNLVMRLGEGALDTARDVGFQISFVGTVFLAMLYLLFHPRELRGEDAVNYMGRVGVDALPIVGMISGLLGLIIAFMSAVQLKQYGANIFVAALVSVAMVRELGPIMTAIVVAGRSGSAFAAEIGTMKVSEEVDALAAMGFDPIRFLVAPKLLAAVVVVPILTMFADLCGILGGMVVGVFMLDVTVTTYVAETLKSLSFVHFTIGLLKSAFFALVIAWIGCLRGFQVSGGASSVGEATTSAVVTSIFLIIVVDAIFAVILRYW